jgi:dipeptidyl-peptidase-4
MKKINLPFFLVLFLLSLAFTSYAQLKQLEISDLQNTKLSPKSLSNLQWIARSDQYSYIANNSLLRCDASKDRRDTLVRLADLNLALEKQSRDKLKRFPGIRWFDDKSFTFTDKNHLYSFDVVQRKLTELNTWPEAAENTDIDYNLFFVAYTRENNLYVSVNGNEVPMSNDKDKNILSGSERVHRNEWGIEKGTFWSPKGNLLAFYRMDESMVADYPLVEISGQIATLQNTKYPMAGQPIHKVQLGICNLSKGKIIFLKTPEDQYLTNISWSPDEKYILIAELNRAQNHMKLKQYDAVTGDFVKILFEEKNDRWVEPSKPAVFLKNQPEKFIWSSERDGWNHLYLYDLNGKMIRQLTKGNWEVNDLVSISEDESRVFITASKEHPLEKHLYSVELNSGNLKLLSSVKGQHRGFFNAKGNLFIDQVNNPEIPNMYTMNTIASKKLFTILESENPLKDYAMGTTELIELKTADGIPLYGRLIKPAGFDPAKKYPVFIYVYGGPHSQLVKYAWLYSAGLYLNYMAAQGYLVFTLDNRGTDNRGFEFMSCIHRKLGDLETDDQMTGVNYLKSLPYVDGSRIGLDGWSYGGFLVISLLTRYPDEFKAACAGGPVTDWKYYEAMYGERYMDTPEENLDGYAKARLTDKAAKLKSDLLIFHGTVDPVVVWQNSLSFLQNCVENSVLVDYFVYPGHEHNVSGKDRLHLYRKIAAHMKDNL